MPRIAADYHQDARQMPFDFPEVVAALAPRAFFANAPVADDNFAVSGVRDCMEAARPVYTFLAAGEKLEAFYPACGHDFSADARKVAYAWLDRQLR
jgi:hypothetical protein